MEANIAVFIYLIGERSAFCLLRLWDILYLWENGWHQYCWSFYWVHFCLPPVATGVVVRLKFKPRKWKREKNWEKIERPISFQKKCARMSRVLNFSTVAEWGNIWDISFSGRMMSMEGAHWKVMKNHSFRFSQMNFNRILRDLEFFRDLIQVFSGKIA